MPTKLYWNNKTTPAELRTLLKTLATDHPILKGNGKGINVSFVRETKPGLCEIKRHGASAEIRYSTPAQAARAVGTLLSELVKPGAVCRETTPFTMLGIMLDCSRNAVMTVDHIQLWLRRLALLGYNMVMLYTEDTYQIPGEPYFGYQRGAYTPEELKAIDDYAARLNIEIIPCIQTLGHLAQILKHAAYRSVKDTSSVMMVGEKATYKLIEKMVAQWRKVSRTNRIHIGMDETHDLGRGRYLDLKGYRNAFELFNEHLAEVVKICKKYHFKPMIWSDMYFRLGCKSRGYYDPETVIPQAVIDKIPKAADLVYWDYYHDNEAFYLNWIKRHRRMGKEPLMGSGIWTWNKYWHDRRLTETLAGPCIDACRKARVKELFFTQWGDNGAYCDHDSAFAGMTWCADKSYGTPEPDSRRLQKRFAAVCGGNYASHSLASDIHGVPNFKPNMWEDPFFETHFRTFTKDNSRKMLAIAKKFGALARKLKPSSGNHATGDMRYAYATAQAFADRYTLSAQLLAAYRKKDKRALRAVVKQIPSARKSVKAMADAFRTMWLSHNKSEGLETIQARFGMLEARYQEMSRRIEEYLSGKIKKIAELDSQCPPR